MINVSLDKALYKQLIDILKEKYYSTMDLEEMIILNKLFLALNCDSNSWVSNKVLERLN